MHDQAHYWSQSARRYEQEFVDPYARAARNPVLEVLSRFNGAGKTVADLGCGIGPLLPLLAQRFSRVHAVDFAAGMLERARERCVGLPNVTFHQRNLTDLGLDPVDVAVAINSLVQPTVTEVEAVLAEIRRLVKPGGLFVGIVPSIDAVHYHTMLLLDRARKAGMPDAKARQNAGQHAEHDLFDFAFGGFTYLGLRQHFWQPWEVDYRLRRAGFVRVRTTRLYLDWSQFAAGSELRDERPPWDWCFRGRAPKEGEPCAS